MSNYIEFIHDQTEWVTGSTFENVSFNDRVLTFDIITKGLFEYDGWYNYYLYTDDTKTELLDSGKCHLTGTENKTTLERPDEVKKILKRF